MPAESNTIFIRDLELQMSIGIYPHEKQALQRVIINIEIDLSGRWDSATIKETVSYEKVINDTIEITESQHFELVENLAEEIAQNCLKKSKVEAVRVRVEKPDIIENTKSVGIEISRKN